MRAYIVLWSSVNDRLKLHLCSSNLQLLLTIVARLIFSMQTTRKEKLFTNLPCIECPIQQSSHLWTLGVSKTCAEKAGFGPRSSLAMFAKGRRFVALDYAQQQRSTTTQPHHARVPLPMYKGQCPHLSDWRQAYARSELPATLYCCTHHRDWWFHVYTNSFAVSPALTPKADQSFFCCTTIGVQMTYSHVFS